MEIGSIKYVDLRNSLGIAAATLHDLCKKENIEALPLQNSGLGKSIQSADTRKILKKRGFLYPEKARIISFIMCKGGVGKTTSAFFTAIRLSNYGSKVLLIDGDPQGNLTSSFHLEKLGFTIDEETPVLSDIFSDKCSLTDSILSVSEQLDIVPSTPMNANLESVFREKCKNPAKPIKRLLKPILDQYDFIIIDCAPSLNLTNSIFMLGSDELILPVNPDSYSKIGLDQTLKEIDMLSNDFPEWVNFKTRILFTRYDGREYTSLKYLSNIAENHTDSLFRTTIRTSTSFKNAIDKCENLFMAKKSYAKEDYDSLAKEIMGLSAIVRKTQAGSQHG
jgi:chromosome partitioning protein